MKRWYSCFAFGLIMGSIAVRPAASAFQGDVASPWKSGSFDTNLYLQHEIFFRQDDPKYGTKISTTDLGGCIGLDDRLSELLPQMLSAQDLEKSLHRGLNRDIFLRCRAEPDGSWFVILDLVHEWCGNRHCCVDHNLEVFRFVGPKASTAPTHLARIYSGANQGWALHPTLADGTVTGMVLVSHNIHEQILEVFRFDASEPQEIGLRFDSRLFSLGSSTAWTGNLVSMRPLGSYPNVGMFILTANDEPIPLLEVFEVTPQGELILAATSRDFGASDDPVAQDTTRLQANLDLIASFEDLTERSGTICPNIDGGWFSGHPHLETRMRTALAPYLVPSRDAISEQFDDWWRLGVSRARSPLVCDPWTTEKRYPRKEWRAAFGNDVYVAVAPSDRVFTSSDGMNWKEPGPPWPGPGNDVAFGHGHFRLVGDGGRVWSSRDGTNWTDVSVDSPDDLRAIATTAKGWIVVGEEGIVVWLTPDAGWLIENIGRDIDLLDVAADDENVVAVGQRGERGIAVSIDDEHGWRITPLPRPLERLWAYRGDFIAADDEGEPWLSHDGVDWLAPGTGEELIVSALEGEFETYVVGFRGRIGSIYKNTGELGWRPGSQEYPEYDPISGELIAGSTGGIALAAVERPGVSPVLSIDFERYHTIEHGEFDPPQRRRIENISRFGGGFIATTPRGDFMWSVDGLHWQESSSYPDDTLSPRLALWVSGPLAFSSGREVHTLDISENGRTWSGIDLSRFEARGIRDITWTGDRWLMLTGNYRILESADGRTWSESTEYANPPHSTQALSNIGGVPVVATVFSQTFALARPDGDSGWCPAWTLDDNASSWSLSAVPEGAVLATNPLSQVLVTDDGDTWYDLLPGKESLDWHSYFRLQDAVPQTGGVDLLAISGDLLMKTECRWRE